nr:uncharacterized protein LOC117681592 isoform X2 [Crassostrea gigas]
MFPFWINQGLILMIKMHILVAMFPDFQTKENINWADVMVKVSTNSGRILRSTALPRQLLVSLTFSTDQLIMFDLKENGEINSNIPIYTVDTDEKIGVQQTASLENVKYYQDQKHQASFMIETNYSSSCMVATFLYQNNEYVMRPEHCLSDIGKDMKFKLAKLNRTHILHSQPLKTDNRRQTFSSEQLKRHKRASTDYKIEMFFIIDYSIYDYWYMQSQATTAGGKDKEAKNSIIQFYSFVVNGIDVRYKTIQSWFTISILYSGIYIADTPHKAQFIENNKYTSSSQTMADSTVVLNAVTSWIKVMYGIPPHDHAMMFTRYDFTNKGSSSNVGLAYVSGMCSDQSVSVVEDHFDFAVLTSAAHELGHGLGAQHDGSGNACDSDDSYIMSAVSRPVQNQNPWKFSTCSVNYFTTFINKLIQEDKNCMAVLSPIYDPGTLKQYTSLPGEIYDADSHCRHIAGPGSSLCRGLYDGNFSSICTTLWCRKTDGSGVCTSAVAGNGLQCGNKKWCISGKCKYDECAPPGDEACLYGDREGVVITYDGKKFTCSFEDIHDDPSVCYHVKDDCCRQCNHFYTGITGCEYGDKTTGCTTQHCPANPSLCCGTCYGGTAITTPSQEPTTTKYVSPCKTTLTTLDPNTTSTTPPSSVSTTSQIPATSTQQTMSQTSITSTTQLTTTSSPSSTPKTLQTTAPTQAPSLVFRLDITLMIDISEDLSIAAVKENVTYKVQTALTLFYQIKGLKFTSCSVQNIRKGSLKVEYEVQTPVDSQVVTNMTSLSKDMATGASKVTYEGQVVTVSSVTLVDTSGNSLAIGNSTTICEIHQLVSACPSGQLCEESNNGPVCRDTEEESIFEKYQIYFICVGAGLGLLVFILIVCCCLKNGKSKLKRANKNSVHGVTNCAMDDLYSQRKNNLHRPDRY